MSYKNSLRLHFVTTTPGAGLATLSADTVDRNELWCIQHLAFVGDKETSGGNTRARLYIAGHGYKHFLLEQFQPVAGLLYSVECPIWLQPLERVALEWDQAQSSTQLDVYIDGYRVDRVGG